MRRRLFTAETRRRTGAGGQGPGAGEVLGPSGQLFGDAGQRQTGYQRRGVGDSSLTPGPWPLIPVFLAGSMLFLAGCMVGPSYKRPAAPVPPAFKEQAPPEFKEANGWKPAQPADSLIKGKWW